MRHRSVKHPRAIRSARLRSLPPTAIAAMAMAALGHFRASPLCAQALDGSIDFLQLHPLQDHRTLPPAPLPDFGLQSIRPIAPPTMQPRSVTDAIWVGLGNSTSWNNSANWSTNLVPDGDLAVARFRSISGGPIARLGLGS